MADIAAVLSVQKQQQKALLRKQNVLSVGTGYKVKDGQVTNELCLVIGVQNKLPPHKISKRDLIPRSLDGIETDVIEVGVIRAQQEISRIQVQEFDPRERHRPIRPGTSIGHPAISAGSFGCVVKRQNKRMILSNNHILAATNYADIGDSIYQPGPADGGVSNDQIARLADYVPIKMEDETPVTPPPAGTCPVANASARAANIFAKIFQSRHRLVAVQDFPEVKITSQTNQVDAAIAEPTVEMIDEIVQIGKPQGIQEAELGVEVQKYGRTTRYTQNRISQINATVQVNYGANLAAVFEQQLITGAMSAGGDSGSVILDMNRNVIGLLFAGSEQITIMNPIHLVFDSLDLSL